MSTPRRFVIPNSDLDVMNWSCCCRPARPIYLKHDRAVFAPLRNQYSPSLGKRDLVLGMVRLGRFESRHSHAATRHTICDNSKDH
jgi:hypothetical protein